MSRGCVTNTCELPFLRTLLFWTGVMDKDRYAGFEQMSEFLEKIDRMSFHDLVECHAATAAQWLLHCARICCPKMLDDRGGLEQ